MTEERPPKRSRHANHSQASSTSALAKVLELGILELSFCAVDELKSLRASSRQLKALVDKELDRRIVDEEVVDLDSSDCIFDLEHEEVDMWGNPIVSSFMMQVGWPQEFSTHDGLVSEAMKYADPDGRDGLEGEPSFTLDSENARRCLRRQNKLKVHHFLQQIDDEEEEEAEWNMDDLDWTVSIEKPRALNKRAALRVLQSDIFSTLERDPWSHIDEEESIDIMQAREVSWVLLCRADPSSFQYSGLKYAFVNNATNHMEQTVQKCLMFRTVDGMEFSFCGVKGANDSG